MVTGISPRAISSSKTAGASNRIAVLADEQAGRLRRVVLGGDVDPVIPLGAGEDRAVVEAVLRDLPLRDRILGVGNGPDPGDEEERSDENGQGSQHVRIPFATTPGGVGEWSAPKAAVPDRRKIARSVRRGNRQPDREADEAGWLSRWRRSQA